MRWIRKRALIAAVVILSYYIFSYAGQDGFAVSFALVATAIIIFGGAFVDRTFFDPSAIFIQKPWRMMRPSPGDVFRMVVLGALVALSLPIVVFRNSYLVDAAIFEGGLIALILFLYEYCRHSVAHVRWHGSGMDVKSKFGQQVVMRWVDVTSVKIGGFGDVVIFRDKAGRKVKISRNLKGFSEFMRDAERYVPPGMQTFVRAAK